MVEEVEEEVVVEVVEVEEKEVEVGGWVTTKVFIHSLSGLALRRVWQEVRAIK